MANQRPLHLFRLFCSVCKCNYEYRKHNKADAMREFDAFGHYSEKTNKLPRDFGRGVVVTPFRRKPRG